MLIQINNPWHLHKENPHNELKRCDVCPFEKSKRQCPLHEDDMHKSISHGTRARTTHTNLVRHGTGARKTHTNAASCAKWTSAVWLPEQTAPEHMQPLAACLNTMDVHFLGTLVVLHNQQGGGLKGGESRLKNENLKFLAGTRGVVGGSGVEAAAWEGDGAASEKTASSWEVISPYATGSGALQEVKFQNWSTTCGRMDRECDTCRSVYVGGSSAPSIASSMEDEAVIDSSEDWFQVDPCCSRLRALNPEDDSEWDLISCEVPVVSAVVLSKHESEIIDHVSSQLDELQLSLKGLMGRERAVLKRQLDSFEDLGAEEPSTLPLLCELSRQVGAVEEELFRLKSLRDAADEEETGVGPQSHEVVLQTKTIPTEQVLREWGPDWLEATRKEISALLEVKKALKEIFQSDIDAMVAAGIEVLRVPMKLVYTIKAVTARRKCRIVLCGNALPNSHETALEKRVATYAGGIDIGLLRFLLADAAKDQLQLATWDISTAFLNAPVQPWDLKAAHNGKQQVTVGVPPRALVRLGLVSPASYVRARYEPPRLGDAQN